MKKLKTIIVLLFICAFANAQNSITATFTGLANQYIKLVGFKGFDAYVIDSTKANEKGRFSCLSAQKTLIWLIFCRKTIKVLL